MSWVDQGYIRCYNSKHPNSDSRGCILEHVLIMSNHIGRPIADSEEIHHIDRDKKNNNIDNLFLCPSALSHKLLHMRINANEACGNSSWRKCNICKKWDSRGCLTRYKNGSGARIFMHKECVTNKSRRYRAKIKTLTSGGR